jgi:hypothetical protein
MNMGVASLFETLDLSECYLYNIKGAGIYSLPGNVHWDLLLDNR